MSSYPHSANASLLGPAPDFEIDDVDATAPTDFAAAFGPFAGSEPIDEPNGVCIEQPTVRERREHRRAHLNKKGPAAVATPRARDHDGKDPS